MSSASLHVSWITASITITSTTSSTTLVIVFVRYLFIVPAGHEVDYNLDSIAIRIGKLLNLHRNNIVTTFCPLSPSSLLCLCLVPLESFNQKEITGFSIFIRASAFEQTILLCKSDKRAQKLWNCGIERSLPPPLCCVVSSDG